MPNQIHHKLKKSRYNKIMKLQQKISKQKLEENIGKELEVLVENKSFDGKYLIGRSKKDVPDIDGVVYIKNSKSDENNINRFIKCKITKVNEYDLVSEE